MSSPDLRSRYRAGRTGRPGLIPAVADRNRLRGRTPSLPSQKRGSPRPAPAEAGDAPGSASFAPLRQVERAGDGPRIGVRGDDMKTQSSHESEVEPAGITPAPPPPRLRTGGPGEAGPDSGGPRVRKQSVARQLRAESDRSETGRWRPFDTRPPGADATQGEGKVRGGAPDSRSSRVAAPAAYRESVLSLPKGTPGLPFQSERIMR